MPLGVRLETDVCVFNDPSQHVDPYGIASFQDNDIKEETTDYG